MSYSIAYFNSNIYTTNIKVATSYGSNILTDGGLEVWTDANNLANWINATGGAPGSETLTQESTPANVYAGTYSAKFTTDAGTNNGKYIAQQKTGLTTGDIYRLTFYAKESTSTATFQIIYINGVLGVATQVFHFTGASAGTWVNGTGAGGIVDPTAGDIPAEANDVITLTNAFALKTCSVNVPVPTNGTIVVVLSAQGTGGAALDLYLDAISFQKVTTGTNANLFDLQSPQDPATYTVLDSILKVRNTGGAGKTWIQVKGDGILYVDGISTSNIYSTSIIAGSGNNISIKMGDDAGSNKVDFLNLSGLSKATIDSLGNISLDGIIEATTSGTLIGKTADGATAVAVILGADADYVTAGSKLVSIRDNIGTSASEKAYIDYLGNFYAPSNKALIIGIENQGTADANGVGITIQADDAGSGGAGNHNGGDINLDIGSPAGSGIYGKINIQHTLTPFGYIGTDTGGRLIIAGKEVNGATAVGLILGSDADYSTTGSKIISFRDNIGAGGSEKLYIGYDGALRTPSDVVAAFGTTAQGAGNNSPGQDVYLQAGNAGSLTTGSYGGSMIIQAGDAGGVGNNNGGSIQLDVGAATGSGTNGAIAFSLSMTTFGFVYKHPTTSTQMWAGNENDGATAIGIILGPAKQYTTTGAKLVTINNYVGNAGGTEKFYIDKDGSYQGQGRILGLQGTDVSSAGDITLGLGNYFDITGTTQINRIAKAGWTAGSRIILQFDAIVTIKDAQTGDATYASILVSSSTDYVSSAGSMVEIIFDGTAWRLYPIFAE